MLGLLSLFSADLMEESSVSSTTCFLGGLPGLRLNGRPGFLTTCSLFISLVGGRPGFLPGFFIFGDLDNEAELSREVCFGGLPGLLFILRLPLPVGISPSGSAEGGAGLFNNLLSGVFTGESLLGRNGDGLIGLRGDELTDARAGDLSIRSGLKG